MKSKNECGKKKDWLFSISIEQNKNAAYFSTLSLAVHSLSAKCKVSKKKKKRLGSNRRNWKKVDFLKLRIFKSIADWHGYNRIHYIYFQVKNAFTTELGDQNWHHPIFGCTFPIYSSLILESKRAQTHIPITISNRKHKNYLAYSSSWNLTYTQTNKKREINTERKKKKNNQKTWTNLIKIVLFF